MTKPTWKWVPDYVGQVPEHTVCSWTAKVDKYKVETYYSHRTHTATVSFGPLRCDVNMGMFYNHQEQLAAVEKWAADIIEECEKI